MHRERALKVVLVVLGFLFSAAVYPLMMMVKQDPALVSVITLFANGSLTLFANGLKVQ